MEDVKDFITQYDRFAGHAEIVLEEISSGSSRARVNIQEKHLNGLGFAHGGAIFTLADLAFAAAANSRKEVAVGINATISYIRPAKKDQTLTATARETFSNRTLSGYLVEVRNESGELVATFQGTAYKKGKTRDHICPSA
ncbi:PaaI family thioesterase [Desulfonatronovibrio hydrogenovorans]|uniref:PaaI family thioesterase n=1 Tax=Desulfonatronovibrio hydrogenovorans TaxID=53245 RepID=UPI000553CF37|nr:hotdog fold thioesterase [Desulfonatronovibrio hydrogenovorans]